LDLLPRSSPPTRSMRGAVRRSHGSARQPSSYIPSSELSERMWRGAPLRARGGGSHTGA